MACKTCNLFSVTLMLLIFLSGASSSVRLLEKADQVTDLIIETCRHTLYFNICMSSLQSTPESSKADLHGLAMISLKVTAGYANETIGLIKQMIANESSKRDDYDSACLDDCSDEYCDAVDELWESTRDLQEQDFESVNVKVSAAMTSSETCEGGFEDEGRPCPLEERNGYFARLCSNAMAIVKLLD